MTTPAGGDGNGVRVLQYTAERAADDKRVRVRVFLAGLVMLALFIGLVILMNREGVLVVVENCGKSAISDVEVETDAGRYPLGGLEPGAEAETTVGAAGESSVFLSWTCSDGKRVTRDADVYFEGTPEGAMNYGGSVQFSVTDDDVRVEDKIGTCIGILSRKAPPTPVR